MSIAERLTVNQPISREYCIRIFRPYCVFHCTLRTTWCLAALLGTPERSVLLPCIRSSRPFFRQSIDLSGPISDKKIRTQEALSWWGEGTFRSIVAKRICYLPSLIFYFFRSLLRVIWRMKAMSPKNILLLWRLLCTVMFINMQTIFSSSLLSFKLFNLLSKNFCFSNH